ncbi:Pivaloyl-CoA mutase small subunit [bacterium HR36]|nr:Pivaloyl-CoA mutase small subunit [bacterium HR36]
MSSDAMNAPRRGNMNTKNQRIVLAKVGLDGHDRGIKVVARALRDAGFEVIYPGLWLSPEAVVRVVAEEDAPWLGISLLSGTHLVLVPKVLELLRQQGLSHVRVVVGGTIPEEDVAPLLACGVAKVFGPGSSLADIVSYFKSEAYHERTRCNSG